ncbi:uncharacterized protein BKA55DRAFT_533573 [Fusarium redolens]|uniref:Uncharacterized protein n=1 Tax=Fusarium redolens TaxID=48865 RepID=A0A9P9R5J8_FUSRE|nr:uncharacterized protein BKA55DRAFT_533573 [Fusarium redolens]KAH7266768.1 hypothetical protein BKA55DRAFT_533573 [Fusarium redolens]
MSLPGYYGYHEDAEKVTATTHQEGFRYYTPYDNTAVMVRDLDAAHLLVIPYSVTNLTKRPENKYPNRDNVIEILCNARAWRRWVADSVQYDPSQLAWVTFNVMPAEITSQKQPSRDRGDISPVLLPSRTGRRGLLKLCPEEKPQGWWYGSNVISMGGAVI